MDGEQILVKLNGYLDAHAGIDCSIHQAGYKDDYFKLFLEAYKGNYFDTSSRPRLTGDAIRDIFIGKGWLENEKFLDRKIRLLETLLPMWDEWFYALNRAGSLIQK